MLFVWVFLLLDITESEIIVMHFFFSWTPAVNLRRLFFQFILLVGAFKPTVFPVQKLNRRRSSLAALGHRTSFHVRPSTEIPEIS